MIESPLHTLTQLQAHHHVEGMPMEKPSVCSATVEFSTESTVDVVVEGIEGFGKPQWIYLGVDQTSGLHYS